MKIIRKNKVTVRVSEYNFESFINECKQNNIVLEDVTKEADGYILTMSFDSFRAIRPIVRKTRVRLRVKKKEGAFYYIHKRRKRYGFYIGALCALVVYMYLTSCIWVVDVTGNHNTPTEDILKVLNKNGIGVGHFKYGKKISYIKNRCLIELDSLTWMWITIDGTRALAEVREHKPGETVFDRGVCCNLTATHSGQIVDMRVRNGKKMVKRGDIVSKGDLLVSGISETKYRGVRYIHSQGEIVARTWRTEEGEFPLAEKKITKTGRESKIYSLELFGCKINNIFMKKIKYNQSEKTTHKKQLKIFNNIYLPLSFTTERFCEIILNNEPVTEDTALKLGTEQLVKRIESQRPANAVTSDVKVESTVLDNGNLYIKVTVESLENIAGESLLQVDLSEEYTIGEDN